MSTATKKVIIAALVFLLATAALFGFMVYQVIGQGALLTQQIDALNKEQEQGNSYNQLLKLAEESVAERALLKSYFLDSNGNGIDLLNSIEAAAPQAGVSLQTESVQLIIDEADDSQWIQATFSVTANRQRVHDFVKVLETLPHVSRVTSVALTSSAPAVWDASIVIQVRVLDYDK